MKNYLEMYQGKVVLVTGGAGAIGSNLTRVIAELGARQVIVLDDRGQAPLQLRHSLVEPLGEDGDQRSHKEHVSRDGDYR